MTWNLRILTAACVCAVCLSLQAAAAARPPSAPAGEPRASIEKHLNERVIKGGVLLHVGGRTSDLAESLGAHGRFVAQIVSDDDQTVEQLRRALHAKGRYGPITAYRLRADRLPYSDNIARLVVVEDALGLPPAELQRVLTPGGLLLQRGGESWTASGKDLLKGMDEWLSIDYDGGKSKASNDALAGQPVGLRWLAYSGMWGIEAPCQNVALMLAADGKIVTVRPSQDRTSMWMVAHCAWSGVLLWATRFNEPTHGRFETYKGRCPGLIADGKVWARGQAMDLNTGEPRFEFKGLPRLAWRNVVLCVTGKEDDARALALGEPTIEGQTVTPKVEVIAYDASTGRQLWQCPGGDVVGLDTNAFVLVADAQESLQATDILTGRIVWRRDTAPDWKSIAGEEKRGRTPHDVELACTQRHILLTWVPSGRGVEGYKGMALPRTVLVYSSADGSLVRAFRFRDARNSLSLWREFCVDSNGIVWCPTDPASVEFREPGRDWTPASAAPATVPAKNLCLVGVDPVKGRISASHPLSDPRLIANRCSDWVMSGNYAYIGDSTFVNVSDGTCGTSGFFRMGCRIPYMPAYGSLYAPPTDYCKCVRRIHGQSLMAFETRGDKSRELAGVTDRDHLQKGPAYGQVAAKPDAVDAMLTRDRALTLPAFAAMVDPAATQPTAIDRRFVLFQSPMPVYGRGLTSMEEARGPRPEWLTNPTPAVQCWVAGDGRIFAAIPNRHRLLVLPARDKPIAWEFTADARLEPDQSPHLVGGLCIFAARDGWIYALRASDGALVWRNLAGAAERRVVAFEQFESPWPVVRNIVVHGGRVYAASGRHGATADVGWIVACFDLWTGQMLWKQRVPAKESVDQGAVRSVATGADEVALDLETHSIRSGAWYFDMDSGAVSSAQDKLKIRMELVLRDGVVLKEGSPPANLHLQLVRDGQRWQRVWAYGPLATLHYGYVADHTIKANQMSFDIVMAINGDAYVPGQHLARYRVTLSGGKWPRTESWSGEFTGFVGPNKVKGSAEGQNVPPPPSATNHQPLAAGEHPRLLFRKADIPRLRQRLEETPLGRAFQQYVKEAKDAAIGQAVLYALQGDKAVADKAKQALFRELDNESNGPWNTGQVWPHRILMIAAVWDGCRDAFTEAENARIEDTLMKRMEWLFWNRRGGGFNAAPTSNWGGPTRAAGAIASLLFANDPGEGPPAPLSRTEDKSKHGYPVHPLYGEIYRKPADGQKPDGEIAAALADFGRLERTDWEADGKKDFVKQFCVETGRQFVRLYTQIGMGIGGFQSESGGYSHHGAYGPVAYQHVHRQVFGCDPSPFADAAAYIPRHVASHVAGDLQVAGYDGKPKRVRSYGIPIDGVNEIDLRFLAALWPVTSPSYRPGVLRMWNRLADIEDAGKPDQAAQLIARGDPVFAFLNYPLDLRPEAPEPPVWPLSWQAPKRGYYSFRNAYRSADDIIVQIFGKQTCAKGWNHPDAGAFTLWGFGKPWAISVEDRGGRRDWESVVLLPKDDTDEMACGDVTCSPPQADGSGQLTIDLDAVYAARGAARDRDDWGYPIPVDRSAQPIRGARAIAVDYSGLSGAPLLMVIADRIEGGGQRLWQWQLPHDAGAKVEYQDRGFRLKQGDATLQVTLVHPAAVKFVKPVDYQPASRPTRGDPDHLSYAVRVAGADHFIAVATLSKGDPPAVTFTGAGLNTAIQVGARTIHLRNDRFDLREARGRAEPVRTAPIEVAGEWPSHLGPAGGFADGSATPVKLLDNIAQAKPVWESDVCDIGFGAAGDDAMAKGYAGGARLAFGGAASPILAGGLVIQSYAKPSGPAWDQPARDRLDLEFGDFARICAADTVVAIEAATGRTKWKQQFLYDGLNYPAGPRDIWNVTPCSADGRVFTFGTTGRVYAMDLARGQFLWESNIGAAHERLESAKRNALADGRLAKAPPRPYGMMIVVDGILLAPDWQGGLVAFDPPTGRMLWRSDEGISLTSGYSSPTPVRVNGKPYIACVNLEGVLRLLEPRTGKVLWSTHLGTYHTAQPVFAKESLLVFQSHPECRHAADTPAVKRTGALAAYRLREDGAQHLWQLDGAKFGVDLSAEATPLRKIATHCDGIVYCAVQNGQRTGLAIVRESDGKVLGELADCGRFDRFHLWGDRLLLNDAANDRQAAWRVYDLNAEKPAALGTGVLPSKNHPVLGDEMPTYEILADGFMFIREWREGWGGGISCYDLRKGRTGAAVPERQP